MLLTTSALSPNVKVSRDRKESFAKFFLSLGNVLSKKSKNFSAKCDINETTKDDLGGQCLVFNFYE